MMQGHWNIYLTFGGIVQGLPTALRSILFWSRSSVLQSPYRSSKGAIECKEVGEYTRTAYLDVQAKNRSRPVVVQNEMAVEV
jgi:hypothetical protein